MSTERQPVQPLEWRGDRVRFLDQTLLPREEVYVETDDETVVADAIRRLAIRGAPLIGIAAAYGLVLAMNKLAGNDPAASFERSYTLLASTRPTAVNLFWALERMRKVFTESRHVSLPALKKNLLTEAQAIHAEDAEMCHRIAEHGARLLPPDASILTHCNTGRLATGGIGTALGVIQAAWEQGTLKHVYIDETRPLLQEARLTAWELSKLGIPATLMIDSAAGFIMKQGLVNAIVVGADRIAANGDTANKVGTYELALLAKHHNIPFYVAAPSSSIDFETASGEFIPIEQRPKSEVTAFFDNKLADEGIEVYNPAFDITPHELVTSIITEAGVVDSPSAASLATLRSRLARQFLEKHDSVVS